MGDVLVMGLLAIAIVLLDCCEGGQKGRNMCFRYDVLPRRIKRALRPGNRGRSCSTK